MADINLLPDDFRKEEERLKEKARSKKSSDERIRLTEPEKSGPDITKKFWHKVYKQGAAVNPTDSEYTTPLEQAVAKSFSKKARTTPNFLADETADKRPSRGEETDKEPRDIFDDEYEYEETKGEKQAKGLRKKGAIRESGELKKKEKAPDILIEKTDDDGDGTFASRTKKLLSYFTRRIISLFSGYAIENVEVNLMPEHVVGFEEINWKKIVTTFFSVTILALVIVAAGYTGILTRIRSEERSFNELQISIEELHLRIRESADLQKQAFAVEQELSDAKKLITNHISWTKFLTFIENTTLPNVRYGNFTGFVDTPITIFATADSIETVILQRQVLSESPYVIAVTINSYTENLDGLVEFEFTLTLNPAVWRRS